MPEQVAARTLRNQVSMAQSAWARRNAEETSKWAEEAVGSNPERFDMQLLLAQAKIKIGPAEIDNQAVARIEGASDSWEGDLEVARLWQKVGEPNKAALIFLRAFKRGGTAVTPAAREIIKAQEDIGENEVALRIRQALLPQTMPKIQPPAPVAPMTPSVTKSGARTRRRTS